MAEAVARVKICGITNFKDAMTAVNAGADALGFIFASSPRRIMPADARSIIKALPPFIIKVGVFIDMDRKTIRSIIDQTGLNAVQLHGNEPPAGCREFPVPAIKRIKIGPGDTRRLIEEKMKAYDVAAFLLDPGTGSGMRFDWTIAQSLNKNIIIAGGLNVDNVGEAIRLLKPYGVDICSGVEKSKGIKDAAKVKKFIAEVRKCLPV